MAYNAVAAVSCTLGKAAERIIGDLNLNLLAGMSILDDFKREGEGDASKSLIVILVLL
jgi:hypothetical protein